MKKFYGTMFVAALFSSATVFAQDAPAKKFFIGGTGGFSSGKSQQLANTVPSGPPNYVVVENKGTQYYIAPEFGFYIKQHVALGIKLGYRHIDGDNTYGSNEFSASPFVRFVIPIGKSRFSVYNDLGISAGFGKYVELVPVDGIGRSADAKTFNLGAFYEPGLQFRLKNNISLLGTLGNLFNYNYNQKKQTLRYDPMLPANTPSVTSSGHSVGINSDSFAFNSIRVGINLLF